MGPLVLGFLPSIMARTAYLARFKVKQALKPYYAACHDQEVEASDFVRLRSRLLRSYDLPLDELAQNEVSIMLAATTNTVPTLFWFVVHVFLRKDLVEELRDEVSKALGLSKERPSRSGKLVISIPFAKIEAACPLLASCYRESVRLASQIITFRRVLDDTIISDPATGEEYLLKRGCNVMMPAKVVHRNPTVWGSDAEIFNPRRFVSASIDNRESVAKSRDLDRLRKASFVPFGGGKHLCPGRHFAFAENLAIMSALLLGYDIEGLDEKKLRMRDSKMGEAAKPAPGREGGPVRIHRRTYWEDIVWRFS
jgi:cytochrome P450